MRRPIACGPGCACAPCMAAFGQLVPPSPSTALVSDEVLRDLSLRSFAFTWPAMQEKLRAEMARERHITLVMTAVAIATVITANKLLR